MKTTTNTATIPVATAAMKFAASGPCTFTQTLRCPICGEERVVEAGTKNVKCRLCRNTLEVKLFPNKENYVRGFGVTANGNDTLDIGDTTADLLRGLDVVEAMEATAEAISSLPPKMQFSAKMAKNFDKFDGAIVDFFKAKYENLNEGMIRMNLGNVLRGALKRASN